MGKRRAKVPHSHFLLTIHGYLGVLSWVYSCDDYIFPFQADSHCGLLLIHWPRYYFSSPFQNSIARFSTLCYWMSSFSLNPIIPVYRYISLGLFFTSGEDKNVVELCVRVRLKFDCYSNFRFPSFIYMNFTYILQTFIMDYVLFCRLIFFASRILLACVWGVC